MKIGCTLGHKDMEKLSFVAKSGFDYVEVELNAYAVCPQEEYEAFKKAVKDNGIPCEAANCLFPGSLKLCDDSFNEKAIEEYLEKAFARAKDTGIDTVVFGSGASRKIPEGFSREKALEQLEKTCVKYLDPIGAKYGITVVIEPLNTGETNVFNTVKETAEFLKKLNLGNVKCLADSYHMAVEKEPYANIKLAGADLYHTHIANPDGRVIPLETDTDKYDEFFKSLEEIKFSGRLSVEAGVPKDTTLEEALTRCAKFIRSKI